MPSEKTTLIGASLTGFLGPDGLKQVAKKVSILGPLAGFGRGAYLHYFGKQSDLKAYFPQELKRRFFRGFPVTCTQGPDPLFQRSPTEDR